MSVGVSLAVGLMCYVIHEQQAFTHIGECDYRVVELATGPVDEAHVEARLGKGGIDVAIFGKRFVKLRTDKVRSEVE